MSSARSSGRGSFHCKYPWNDRWSGDPTRQAAVLANSKRGWCRAGDEASIDGLHLHFTELLPLPPLVVRSAGKR